MSDIHHRAEPAGRRLALADGSASLLLVPRLGLALPRFHFHIGRVVHASQELGLFRVQTTLLLGNDHTGHGELAELQADPRLDAGAQTRALQQLVQAACELVSASPQDFGTALVAELPGWRDAAGASPFWQALGARFYAGDPAAAQARLGHAWCSHLAALLPRQSVYLSFMGEAAAARLAEPALTARPAFAALRAAGFQPPAHVRIDDGGPVLCWHAPSGGS